MIKAKRSNKFCKGRQFALLCKIGYFPYRNFGIFIFEIMILLNEFLEHLA